MDIVSIGIGPEPLVVNPETPAVALAVQAKEVPAIPELRVTAVVLPPEQMVCDNVEFVTVGKGFTVTVMVYGAPGHDPVVEVGVTIY